MTRRRAAVSRSPGPSFDVLPAESRVIHAIARRAVADLQIARRNDPFTQMDVAMDVTAVHANGNKLRLEALRDADGFNFAHDVLGIRRHLDRDTGRLIGGFSPRYSVRP